MRVMAIRFTHDQQAVCALHHRQLVALDPRERLECRARGAAALRAMAIGGVHKRILHLITHLAAKTLAG